MMAVIGEQHFLTTTVVGERLPEIPDGGMPEQERKCAKSKLEIASAMVLASVGIYKATRWRSNLARSQKIFWRNFMARGKQHSLIVTSNHDGGPPKFRGPRMEAPVYRPELLNVNVP
jgi:hypothetical protein